jgi:hypothetical protein
LTAAPPQAPSRPRDGRFIVGRHCGKPILVRLASGDRNVTLDLPLLAAREKAGIDWLLEPFIGADGYTVPRGVYLRWTRQAI